MGRDNQHSGTNWPDGRCEMTRECSETTWKRSEMVEDGTTRSSKRFITGAKMKPGSAYNLCKISFTPAVTCPPLRPSPIIRAVQTWRHLDTHLPSLARSCITGSRFSPVTGNYLVTTLTRLEWTAARTPVVGLFHWRSTKYITKQITSPTYKLINLKITTWDYESCTWTVNSRITYLSKTIR